MAKSLRSFSLMAAVVLVLLAAGAAAASSLAIDTAADQNGNVHRWSAQEGAVTILDFAASWCGPCRESLPRLEAFAAAHPEVRVLVISVDERPRGRDALVRELGLELPVVWDEDHRAAEHYRPGGMPATFVFDRAGHEILSVVGSDLEEWQRVVTAVEGELRRAAAGAP